jgi:hypothetical protein
MTLSTRILLISFSFVPERNFSNAKSQRPKGARDYNLSPSFQNLDAFALAIAGIQDDFPWHLLGVQRWDKKNPAS